MKILNLILFLVFMIMFCSCELSRSAEVNTQYSATVQPAVVAKPTEDVKTNQANTLADKDSVECVRAEPEAIIDKKVFLKTKFHLEKNKEFPFQNLGYETVEFENGDKLLIENVGCENYTLIFHFETGRFSHDINDVIFWYKTAAELMKETNRGLRDEDKQRGGLKALNSYIKKTKQPKLNEEIDYCGTEIRCVVSLNEVKQLENNKIEIIMSFGTGPL